MIIESILQHFTKEEKDRDWSKGLRGSSAGKCARAIAYQIHGYEAEPLSARARMVFRMGDLVEQDLVNACLSSGVDLVNQQEEVSLIIDGVEIKGHIDGQIGSTIIDFKSTNTFRFRECKKGTVDDSYKAQMHFYMKAKGLKNALIVYYDKNTSQVCECPVDWDDAIWNQVEQRFKAVINSTKESLPGREYKLTSKGTLPWQCSYCAYNKHCWPNQETSLVNGKPVTTVKGE